MFQKQTIFCVSQIPCYPNTMPPFFPCIHLQYREKAINFRGLGGGEHLLLFVNISLKTNNKLQVNKSIQYNKEEISVLYINSKTISVNK